MSINHETGPSWTWVIVWIILFFPAGFWFLFKKLTEDETNLIKNSKVYKNYGWTILVIGVLLFISSLPAENSDTQTSYTGYLIWGIIMCLWGYYLIHKAKKIRKLNDVYQKYLSIIGKNYITSIDDISAISGINYDKTMKDIQNMVELGFFGSGFINKAQHELVIPFRKPNKDNRKQRTSTSDTYQEYSQKTNATQTKVVTCKNCGANNTVTIGITSECEFCGSPIN